MNKLGIFHAQVGTLSCYPYVILSITNGIVSSKIFYKRDDFK